MTTTDPRPVARHLDIVVRATRHRIPSRLLWTPADPLAVTLELRPPGRGVVEWVIARDLLLRALYAQACGDGDVLLDTEGPDLLLGLRSPDGEGAFVADAVTVADFVHDTEREIPTCDGCDELWCAQCAAVATDLDKALAALVTGDWS